MTDCNLAARECHIHSFSCLLFALALRPERFFLGIESTDRKNRVERRILFVIHLETIKNKKIDLQPDDFINFHKNEEQILFICLSGFVDNWFESLTTNYFQISK